MKDDDVAARNRRIMEQIRLLERDDQIGLDEFVRDHNRRSNQGRRDDQ